MEFFSPSSLILKVSILSTSLLLIHLWQALVVAFDLRRSRLELRIRTGDPAEEEDAAGLRFFSTKPG